jgi:hypothetical protein
MDARGRSITGGGESFPKFSGPPKWANEKTMVIPVTLQPEHDYYLGVNSESFKGFVNKRAEPAERYPIQFKTRAAGSAAAEPDVTPEQNKDALAALKQAIDDDYGYRDRKKIDWAKEIAKRQAKFEAAKSANEFARLTAHLLRLAEDAHVSVEAGDVQIGTRANSARRISTSTSCRKPCRTGRSNRVASSPADSTTGSDTSSFPTAQRSRRTRSSRRWTK